MDIYATLDPAAFEQNVCWASAPETPAATPKEEAKAPAEPKDNYKEAEKKPDVWDKIFCALGHGIFYGGKCHYQKFSRMVR